MLTIAWLAGCCLCGVAQEATLHKVRIPPQPLLTQSYQEVKEANLPITGVKAIYQGSDETVWISTQQEGLVAYTGNSIKRYRHDPKNNQSLHSNRIEEVWEESPHLLWITTFDRIVKFNRLTNHFTRFPVNSRYVCKTPDGTLYTTVVGKGLYRIDTAAKTLHPVKDQTVISEKGAHYPEEKMAFINKMVVDGEGTLWIAGKANSIEGLFRLDTATGRWIWHAPDAYYNITTVNPLQIYKTENVRTISAATLHIEKNKVWLGGFGQGLLCYDKQNGQWEQFYFYRNHHTYVNDNVVLAVSPLNHQELWVSSAANSFTFNPEQVRVYDFTFLPRKGASPPLQEGTLLTIADHCGNRWLAGEYGVFKYNPQQDYFSNAIKDKLSIEDNQLITAAYQLGPDHYLLGIVHSNVQDADMKTEIQEMKSGRLLRRIVVGKNKDRFWPQQFLPGDNGVFYYCAQNLHRLDLKKGQLQTIPVLVKNEPTYLHHDYWNNILWNDSTLFSCRRTSANAGLVKINPLTGEAWVYKTDRTKPPEKSPQDNSVLRLMRDSYNRIWCRTAGGVDIFYPDKETFEHYTPVDADSTSLLGMGANFCEGRDKTFYTASISGVSATKAVPGTKATFEHLTYLDGAWIVADKAGMVWVGTEKGVAHLDPATKMYKIYNRKNGYKWHPLRKPHLLNNGFFLMDDGTVVDPAAIAQNQFKPLPRLTDFLVAGRPSVLDTAIEFKQHIRLSHDENFFSFRYTCNNYINEEDNLFRYQLKGVDKDWVEAGTRTEAYYTALKPGIYHFYVQAANNDGTWGAGKKMVTVTIIPAWYQTAWFKVAIALLVGLTAFAFYHQRMLHLKTKLVAQKQKAEMRQQEAEMKTLKAEFEKQLAQTEMAALRSQMNPHFIFNCLNSIKLYTLQNNTEAATEYLSKFSRLIRLVLENSRMSTIPLHAELEYLRLYMDMEVMRFKQKLQYTIRIDAAVDTEFIELPPLLLQPYVENAIWHGLMHKEQGGQIDINLNMQDNTVLVITITDNGIGRAKAADLKSKGATAKKSFGMKVTSERIALINKLYRTHTHISIQDLVDSEGQPAGTEVTIKIPLYDTLANHHRG